MGYSSAEGPWLPIGVGVHTGVAYVGTVQGAERVVSDFTALGDNVNIAARLGGAAGEGEAIISDAAFTAANLQIGPLERRQLALKGKSDAVGVHVLAL